MGLLGNVTRLGLAKKGFDLLRKPENQARIKSTAAKVRSKAASRSAKRSR